MDCLWFLKIIQLQQMESSTIHMVLDSVYEGVVFEKPANYGRQHGQHLAKQSRLGRQYLSFFNDVFLCEWK